MLVTAVPGRQHVARLRHSELAGRFLAEQVVEFLLRHFLSSAMVIGMRAAEVGGFVLTVIRRVGALLHCFQELDRASLSSSERYRRSNGLCLR